MLRQIFVYLVIVGLIALGIDDLIHHRYKTGIASICLGIANGLLLL